MNDENLIKNLPLSIGEYSTDLKYAQDVCVYLCEKHTNEEVRANSVLGLSYLARRFGTLSEKIVPCLEKEYVCNKKFRGRIVSAIEDIELFTEGRIKI